MLTLMPCHSARRAGRNAREVPKAPAASTRRVTLVVVQARDVDQPRGGDVGRWLMAAMAQVVLLRGRG